MGKISKRIALARSQENVRRKPVGFCQICNIRGILSADHIPPKAAVKPSKAYQKLMTEALTDNPDSVQPVTSHNGSTFKTICKVCNNLLGNTGDKEIGHVRKLAGSIILNWDQYPQSKRKGLFPPALTLNCSNYIRAMVGHILAATSTSTCHSFHPEEGSYLADLQMISRLGIMPERKLNFYYWPYPFRDCMSVRQMVYWKGGRHMRMSVLMFFPFAFVVAYADDNPLYFLPKYAFEVTMESRSMFVDLCLNEISKYRFPFTELSDNNMYGFQDSETAYSWPDSLE